MEFEVPVGRALADRSGPVSNSKSTVGEHVWTEGTGCSFKRLGQSGEKEWQVTALAQALENLEHLAEDKEVIRGGS